MTPIHRPDLEDVPLFYRGYLEMAEGHHLLEALRLASDRVWEVVGRMETGQERHAYAPRKWTVAEVLQHVIDSERIFCYRALRFAREDRAELPGFDENTYVPASRTAHRPFHHLLREHDTVRAGTVELFRSFDEAMLGQHGIANGQRIGVRAIGWVIAGHAQHHALVINQRYLNNG
ncbi:MAG: DinB family protein [Flavobacteriales bacterium]|nr:DinB family protein [Flavobacteriales bacterium]